MWFDSFICILSLIYMCDMTHSYVSCDSFVCVTWLNHMLCDVTHSYVRHDAFVCISWLIHVCDMTPSYISHHHSYVWYDSFIRVRWLIHTCDMTHSYVWHDSFIRVKWRIHTCDMTHAYVWHDSFKRGTWLIHLRYVTLYGFNSLSEYLKRKGAKPRPCYMWMCHVKLVNEPCHIYQTVMVHMRMSHVTHMKESCRRHCMGSIRYSNISNARAPTIQSIIMRAKLATNLKPLSWKLKP